MWFRARFHFRFDQRAQASHQIAVEHTLARPPPRALHAPRLPVGALGHRSYLPHEAAAEEIAVVRGEEIGQTEIERENVGERAVALPALGEGLGHVAGQCRLLLPVVTQKDVHRLAERTGPEEANATTVVPITAPAPDR
jgi:hypothetical protein